MRLERETGATCGLLGLESQIMEMEAMRVDGSREINGAEG